MLAFVRERGAVHPRDVDAHFSHGTVKNYWGGSSHATTRLLQAMHYKRQLRVARRDGDCCLLPAPARGADPGGNIQRMDSSKPVVWLALEPKTKADEENLGQGLADTDGRGLTIRIGADQ